ncbi:SpoIIE family protein phosphatase [Vitiosangium sp. GDMCC 1.1324]|uniref:SpoIIE family protein phosphatase n=1 Tax=Vitiosangium sp. (strain GDMCC 1.1324) TaxID=2138576 RepID=UPI00130E2789|nr:SpoIIE family protein phosphatase [Vitiosangium sp. GDMCC 1.1324]
MRELQGAVRVEGREDRAALFEYEDGVVVVVADGAGGTGRGAEAAQGVIDAVRRLGWSPEVSTWVDLLGRLDSILSPGQTTAVIVAVGPTRLTGASVGDSEAWWFDGLTEHPLTQGQRRKPLLGSGEAVPVGFSLEVRGEGSLVLGSDGLWKYVRWARVPDALQHSPQEAALRLLESVRYPSGKLPDDVAVVVCRVGSGAPETPVP